MTLHGHSPDLIDFSTARQDMVERQLRTRDIQDPRVLRATGEVPREAFVAPELRTAAYEDRPLPVGFAQTISQPYTVAYMCQALRLRGDERVLEIGTGSGYGAAVLGRLAARIHSIERVPELAEQARVRLELLGCANVLVHLGDGTKGLAEWAPFDAILATAGGYELPQPYLDQLADGGRIVIPLGHHQGSQTMWRFTRRRDQLNQDDLGRFAFVPLIGAWGWQ